MASFYIVDTQSVNNIYMTQKRLSGTTVILIYRKSTTKS